MRKYSDGDDKGGEGEETCELEAEEDSAIKGREERQRENERDNTGHTYVRMAMGERKVRQWEAEAW